MRPTSWRRIFLPKLAISAIFLFIVLYIVLFKLPKSPRASFYTDYGNSFLQSSFRLQQNGEYWIYHDFIRARSRDLYGNQTITFATHASYLDLKKLEWLLARWNGPISLAIYVTGDNFEATLMSFYHIKYCTIYGFAFNHWVSVQLIFVDKDMPSNVRGMGPGRPRRFVCKAPYESPPENTSFWHKHDQKYPLHLLKNVARLNANTYFVLSTELNILPTRHFIRCFMQFVETYLPAKPLQSVFCIPIFPQIVDDLNIPKYKSELVILMTPYLEPSHLSFSISPAEWEQLKVLGPWLNTSVLDGDIAVYQVSKSPEHCAAYVSINAYEPLYDQRYAESPYVTNSTRFKVLTGLGFDFIVLDGTFLIQRRAAVWEENRPSCYRTAPAAQKLNHIHELIKFNSLTLWPSTV